MTERKEIYEVEFVGLDLSNRTERILAKDFEDAYRLATILLKKHKKAITEDAEIVRLEYEDTVEDIEE